MILKCRNKKCSWHGTPTFEECDDSIYAKGIYVKAICPKCHVFIKLIQRQDVPKDCIIEEKDFWWSKIKATESDLRPAYMIQRDLSKLRVDYAVLQVENEKMEKIIKEATDIIKEALEREGIIKYVPEWLKE